MMRFASVIGAHPRITCASLSVLSYSALPVTTASQPRSRSAQMSSAVRTPPLAITGRSVSFSTRSVEAQVGALQRAVARDRRHEVPRRPASFELPASRPRAPGLPPSSRCTITRRRARRPRRRRARRAPRRRVARTSGRAAARGAEDHARRARAASISPILRATGCRRRPARGSQTLRQIAGDHLAVVALLERRVEVDDVQPPRAFLLEPHGAPRPDRPSTRSRCRGRRAPGARRGRRAGRSPGSRSCRRHRLHERSRRCCSPASPDFSGWNCVANTLSRATADAKDGRGP